MPEPNAPVETDAGKATEPEMVQIAKAELEGLQADQKVISEIQAKAKDAGFDNVEEYNVALEGWAYDNLQKQPEETQTPAVKTDVPAQKLPAPTVTAPAIAEIPQKFIDDIATAKGMSTTVYMQMSYMGYDINNKAKLPAERSAYSKDDLLKVINGPRRATVQHLASQDTSFEGNVYTVADFLLSQAADSKRRKEESDKSKVALNKAEETANIDSTTAPASAPETEQSENDKQADLIAPSDAPIE